MMRHWFTEPSASLEKGFVKRFDPAHWTIDFPRGAMASVVTNDDPHTLSVQARFLRTNDLVGLVWESEDRYAHPAHRRETRSDYSNCVLQFHWRSEGLLPLDAVNGPTLTIEGLDAEGRERSWYVRLWNYADGRPDEADIRLDFNALDGGFTLPAEAQRVDPRAIRRLFISLVPPQYEAASHDLLPVPTSASLQLSDIRCDGSGSVIPINDAMVPEHRYRICTGYDDLYHLTPERVVDSIERLGFRGVINHYVGMSHYPALTAAGLVDPQHGLNEPAAAWHRSFARLARQRSYRVIWSLSFEILDQFCPEDWKQRAWDGAPALTGYEPPSTLISPASAKAVAYLAKVAEAFCAIASEAGLAVEFQLGEPWWWVRSDHQICLYDQAARSHLGGDIPFIADVRGARSAEESSLLDRAGTLLSDATNAIATAVKVQHPEARTLLLTYLPGSLRADAPELRRANLPVGWSAPAFDVLQLEDYEWVTGGLRLQRQRCVEEASARLGYPPADQHYLAGFVSRPDAKHEWSEVLVAAQDAERRGVGEVFIWALPQILRDGVTLFSGDEAVAPFDDILFPIEIGAEASVAPEFSTAVVTSASGHEFRNANWSQARLRFDAGPGVRGEEELASLISFFRARRGSAVGFRFRDPFDHSSGGMVDVPSAFDQRLGVGDGARTRFPLTKAYGEGEVRKITRPVRNSVRVGVSQSEKVTGWTLLVGGVVAFDEPPAPGAEVTAGFLFDVPVRFGDDHLEISRASFRAGDAPSVPLIEIREALDD